MENEDGPFTKKQRRSHHKNQLPAFCYCAKCAGKIKQKPRTIDDHRTRYPHRSISPGQPELIAGFRESAANQYPDDTAHLRGEPGQSPPSPDRSLPPSRPTSPTGASEANNVSIHFTGTPSARRARMLVISPNRLDPGHQPASDEEDNEPEGIPEEEAQDYPFEQLLDDSPVWRNDYNNFLGLGGGHEGEDTSDLNDPLYDEDFGLPDGEAAPEAVLPQFQIPLGEESVSDPEDDPNGDCSVEQCAAFQEPDLIRNAYIDAFVQKSLYGATQRALKHQLKSARRTIATHPDIHAEEIAKMAQTISTVERRLGVSTDSIITTFTLCPICKRRYSPESIADAASDQCLNEGCPGVLFVTRKMASGSQRRVSNLTYPFASPIAWIRHILNLAGMAELMQSWRNDDDKNHGLVSPVPSADWMHNLDPQKAIGDMSDGWGWRSTAAGLERCQDPNTGNIVDRSVLDPPVRFVSLPFGLSLSMNTDWFQATKEGNYSVGACYLVINNIPRHMRFLRENIALCLVMPGPNEPDNYALNEMLDPLVDKLLALKQGVRMTVRQGDPPIYHEEVVHGELTQHIADLIARIKLGGGAGVRSERNFCLYCHMRLSSLSAAAGYDRQGFQFCDPQEELNNVFQWKDQPTREQQKLLFDRTGNRFTALHRIPGWHTSTSSPLDAMHLLYLGATNWIVKQILVGPGMLNKRRATDRDPQELFNECLDRMWMPKNFQRLPPKLGQTRVSIKADQWKLAARTIYIPLFMALRDGDELGPGFVTRGNQNSPGWKHQTHRAKLLHHQQRKYYEQRGELDQCPPLEECYPSCSVSFHYRQVLRFSLATSIIDKRSVTPEDIAFAQSLLEALCIDYVNKNVPLAPNFHYMMHLEESMLKTGSVYNTHVWGMERANGILSRINHNGRGGGVLEGTLMRGWWSHTTIQNLIKNLRALPNRTPADNSIIEDLLTSLRGGAEHAQQRGTLMAFIAQCETAYTQLHGIQDSTRLSKQSRVINLERHGLYQIVLQFCLVTWPDAGIFGPGLPRRLYLAPEGMVRNHSYVEYNGIRYGAYEHTSGKGYCYGYTDNRHPVRIEQVLHIEFPGEENMHCVCVLVRPFQLPTVVPYFPWDAWSSNLGVSSWAYGELGELSAISADRFSGTFALFEISMSYGEYWVTVALDSLTPERDAPDDIE